MIKLNLTKLQINQIKKIFGFNKANYAKIQKLEDKKKELDKQIQEIQNEIDTWETPIKSICDGLNSKQVLDLLSSVGLPEEAINVNLETTPEVSNESLKDIPETSEGILDPEVNTPWTL